MADEQKPVDGITRAEFYSVISVVLYLLAAVLVVATQTNRDWKGDAYSILLMVIVMAMAITFQVRSRRGQPRSKFSRAAVIFALVWWFIVSAAIVSLVVHSTGGRLSGVPNKQSKITP
ncbi:MAG TPA: hypothetical protein VL486_04775 [Verrucomicrobiae bacterium]|nr:hypothetical protein [Verrucomicrobiae bacterium]